MPTLDTFASRLLHWHQHHGRKGLPWQGVRDPYHVWVSEIMLQQTQVATVLERYVEFIKKFPNIQALANATEEEVLAMWAGLGYYSRARNLHACAQQVVHKFGGSFPRSAELLETLPGIGRSTAAAIASFCFDERVSILDANVARVLARISNLQVPINSSVGNQMLWELAQRVIPEKAIDMPQYTQALMDYGSQVCTSTKPRCQISLDTYSCVFQDKCLAFDFGSVSQIPIKIKKIKVQSVYSEMLFLRTPSEVLLQKRPSSGIWGGLWTLPETPWVTHATSYSLAAYSQEFQDALQHSYELAKQLPIRKHQFSHRTLWYCIRTINFPNAFIPIPENAQWVKFVDLERFGLPTPIKQLLLDYGVKLQ